MNKKVALFFIFIATFIVIAWFEPGKMIATGEEGLTLANPLRTFNLYKSIWYETGLGYPMPVFLPRVTFFGFAAFLSAFLKPWLVQAIFYWMMIFAGLTGAYLLVEETFSNHKIAFISALFYLFNLYTMSQVWSRFLYAGMTAWAFLPLFLFLFIKVLNDKKIKWWAFFLLASLVFSNTFGHPAYIFTFWIPAGLLTVFFTWTNRSKKRKVARLLGKAILLLITWVVVNIWWIIPYLTIGSIALSEISSTSYNFDSLRGVSKYFPTSEIILLKQNYLFGEASRFVSFYSNNWIKTLSFFVFVVSLFGWLVIRKTKYWLYFTLLAIFGWFVSKGANPPYGHEFFNWLFNSFPATASLRNSYEKFGLVWLIPYSVFFSAGINALFEYANSIKKRFLVLTFLLFTLGFLVWPMWTGILYAKNKRVSIPKYYTEANNLISEVKEDNRILMLPMITGDSIEFDWGYSGIEPSEFLFDKPVISRMLRQSLPDSKYIELYSVFTHNKDFKHLFKEMNVEFIVLRRDLSENYKGNVSPELFASRFEEDEEISKVGEFGKLEVYRFDPSDGIGLFTIEKGSAGQISFEKISSTNYKVIVINAHEPLTIVFKQTFSDLWKAEVDGEEIAQHFLIYNYANSWRVDKTDDYEIDITFGK